MQPESAGENTTGKIYESMAYTHPKRGQESAGKMNAAKSVNRCNIKDSYKSAEAKSKAEGHQRLKTDKRAFIILPLLALSYSDRYYHGPACTLQKTDSTEAVRYLFNHPLKGPKRFRRRG